MKKLLALLFLSMVAQVSFASTSCICQTGSMPKEQIPFFKAGCKMWLMSRTCDEKKTVSVDEDLSKILSPDVRGGKLELGYVGHWPSADETIYFLEQKILPLMTKLDIDVLVDNTACLGMDNAFIVQNYLAQQKINGLKNKLEFTGNQVISIGMWDKILIGHHNLYASASTETDKVSYPACSEFELKVCSRKDQKNQTGLCENNEHKLERLTCKENKRMAVDYNSKSGTTKYLRSRYEWVREKLSFTKNRLIGFDSQGLRVEALDPRAVELKIEGANGINPEYSFPRGPTQLETAGYFLKRLNDQIAQSEAVVDKWNEN
jgi:hypothetical protein